MKRKNEEMKEKIHSLRSQKMELDRRVLEMKSTMDTLKEEQTLMESAFEEKQNEIRMLQVKGSDLGKENLELVSLKEKLEQKEAEIEDLKHRFEVPLKSLWVSSNNDSTNNLEIVSENGKMAAQEKIQTQSNERDEQSLGQSSKYEDGKGIINEDASKSKLTLLKNAETAVEVGDKIVDKKENINDRVTERNEHMQAVGVNGGDRDGSAGVTDEKINIVENAMTKEEQGERVKFHNGTKSEGQDLSLKQLEDNSKISDDEKRKHVRVSRTKGKRWRMIFKNRLLGNHWIFESHGASNMRSRKINRNEQHESMDRVRGRAINDQNIETEDEEMDNSNQGKDKAGAKFEIPGSHDDIEEAQIKTVNDTNQQVTKQRWDEARQSEKQEESGVEQSWSRRHINIVEKNAALERTVNRHDQLDEIQEKEKDIIEDNSDEVDNDDDNSKESQPDEKEEYKGEMDESKAGL